MIRLLVIFFLVVPGTLISSFAGSKEPELIDKIYVQNVKTVRLFPDLNNPDRELLAAAAPLNGEFTLLLEFDDLYADHQNYFVKFIHCNADWTVSRLFPLDFLDDFNEFRIDDYEFSFNTKVPYVHYQFQLPAFRVSGNYVLVVYRESEDNLILTRRFMIYDNQIGLINERGNTGLMNISRMNQEIQFRLDYGGITIDNPYQNIKAVIRQNQRWDNAIYSLSPTFVNEASRMIEFRHFSNENQFEAGNQFRFFDLRSLRYFGRNVETVNLKGQIPVATLEKDKPRGQVSYSEYDDHNGKYLIVHPYESDYAHVQFFIESEKLEAKVYFTGSFSLWSKENMYLMTYLDELNGYYGETLLKQGFYDYQYLVEGIDYKENYFEGDHFETENEYDIMIYYHSFRTDTDQLMGYFRISRNPRF